MELGVVFLVVNEIYIDDKLVIVFKVMDIGIGIVDEKLSIIF